jgi:hypothetical protein
MNVEQRKPRAHVSQSRQLYHPSHRLRMPLEHLLCNSQIKPAISVLKHPLGSDIVSHNLILGDVGQPGELHQSIQAGRVGGGFGRRVGGGGGDVVGGLVSRSGELVDNAVEDGVGGFCFVHRALQNTNCVSPDQRREITRGARRARRTYMPVREPEQLARVQLRQALPLPLEVSCSLHVRHEQFLHRLIEHHAHRRDSHTTRSRCTRRCRRGWSVESLRRTISREIGERRTQSRGAGWSTGGQGGRGAEELVGFEVFNERVGGGTGEVENAKIGKG